MITIGKIGGRGGGQWRQPDYYTQQVANGAEDYYSGKGEAPGTWTGTGAANLGLEGTLGEGDLEALFDRRHPGSGEPLMRPPSQQSVRGIDLQMAVPKSVSTLWAFGEEYGLPEVGAKVWEATHGASAAALDYLERHACASRAGRGGHVNLRGEGFVGAVFPHRFSREGDPQIHVHVLVANMTKAGDPSQGVAPAWRTLDARDIYQHRMAAGYLFQAELRERMTDLLGVEWTPVHKGAAEIAGVPRSLALALSQRRAQIMAKLRQDGRAGTPREAELAALTTRKAKQSFDLPTQRAHWRTLGEEHEFGPDQFRETLGRATFDLPTRGETDDAVAAILGETGLTQERSTFHLRNVVQEVASAHSRGGSVQRIEELAARVVASEQVIAVEGRSDGPSLRHVGAESLRPVEPRLTTADMLDVEAKMLDQAANRRLEGVGVVRLAPEDRFERRPSGLVLSQEQRDMVAQLVTSGAGVEVVQARAGTGKTTAIDAARQLWERDGYRVIGAALAGRAADELRSRGGMESWTVHGLLIELDRGGSWGLGSETVLVVDEAAMVDSRRLAKLLDHAAEARTKVVLIGDARQVPAVEAGGGFASLADRLGSIELTEVHRQRHTWDRRALDELRSGDIGHWIKAYEAHGRLVPKNDTDAQVHALVEDWFVAAQQHGMTDTLMLAARRDEAETLNALGRAARVAAGEIDDRHALAIGDRLFAEGDRALALRGRTVQCSDGQKWHRLRNGNRGTVTRVDALRREVVLRLDAGVEVVLPADYLADGHLTHGYAMTIHKSQAMTTTRTFVLGSPDLARELGYVASSRHTDHARFYVNVGADVDLARPQLPGLEDAPLYGELKRALGHERAKHLALDETEIDAALGELTTEKLIEISDRGRAILTSIPAQARRAKDTERLTHAATKVSAADARLTTARAELAELTRFDRQRRDQLAHRIRGLEESLSAARRELAARTDTAATSGLAESVIQDNEIEIVEAAAAERELTERRADAHWRATRTAALDADPAVERTLGERPDIPSDRERWEKAAAAQESYRLQYGELPHMHAEVDLAGRQADDWKHAHELAAALFDPPSPDPAPDLAAAIDLAD